MMMMTEEEEKETTRRGRRGRRDVTTKTALMMMTTSFFVSSDQPCTSAKAEVELEFASTQLSEKEKQITESFARASKACVNIVDVTLLSQSGIQKSQAGAIVPEGNGSGIVWDSENGYVVTRPFSPTPGKTLALVSPSRSTSRNASRTSSSKIPKKVTATATTVPPFSIFPP